MKSIAVLGSTGSVGCNTLEVALAHPDRIHVASLAAGSNVERLAEQARRHRPRYVAIRDEACYVRLKEALAGSGIEVGAGPSAVREAALVDGVRTVVGAVVGGAGLDAVHAALASGRDLALANKETLVMAGALMGAAAQASGARILPVDSEHNALFQCLDGEAPGAVRRLVLTASGGPFRTVPREQIWNATVEQALNHPTWKMGRKITIDSATLMNKGLEVIEAHFLFGLPASRIDVVIHPKSVVHSLVEMVDGSVLAQLGTADMKIPIRYALSYPERWEGEEGLRLDLLAAGALEFFSPDRHKFPCLDLAYRALQGTTSALVALNAANEVAVAAFLEGRIRFSAIAELIAESLDADERTEPGSVEEILALDASCRAHAAERLRHPLYEAAGAFMLARRA